MQGRVNLPYLLLKFALFATLLFVFWIFILESSYHTLLGKITALIPFPADRVDFVALKGKELIFRLYALRADLGIEARSITANLALFWALILASAFSSLLKRICALIGGTFILCLLHITAIYFIIRLYIQETVLLEGIKVFVDGLLLGLVPLLLWLLFIDKKTREELLGFR